MFSGRVRGSNCPSCSKFLDGATGTDNKSTPPKPGDLTICVYCVEVLQYGSTLELSKFNFESDPELPEETKVKLRQVRAVIRSRQAS